MADPELILHLLAAQIKIPVFQPQQFIGVGRIGYFERRRLGFRENMKLGRVDLNIAGRELGIMRSGGTVVDCPLHRDHELRASPLSLDQHRWVEGLRIDHNLGDAVAVAQVQKEQTAEISISVDPAVEPDRGADIGRAELAASMGTFQFREMGHAVLI